MQDPGGAGTSRTKTVGKTVLAQADARIVAQVRVVAEANAQAQTQSRRKQGHTLGYSTCFGSEWHGFAQGLRLGLFRSSSLWLRKSSRTGTSSTDLCTSPGAGTGTWPGKGLSSGPNTALCQWGGECIFVYGQVYLRTAIKNSGYSFFQKFLKIESKSNEIFPNSEIDKHCRGS